MTTAIDLVSRGKYQDAIDLIAKGKPVDAQTVIAYGKALEMTGKFDAAASLYKSLNEASPCEEFAKQYAACLARVGERDYEELDRLIALYPQNRFLKAAKGEMALVDGDWATGFRLQADRFAVGGAFTVRDQIKLPEWRGEPLDGRLIVVGEQGLGEEVLFSSCFNRLPPAVISCDQRLTGLFSRSFPQHVFVHKSALRHYHGVAACHAMEAFAHTLTDYQPGAWLNTDTAAVHRIRTMLTDHFKGQQLVGLSWFSARKNLSESKSIPVDQLGGLFDDRRAIINLQYGDILADVKQLEDAGHIVYALDGIDVTNDLDGLCSLISALDVVVTCSNTVAHFAGALGKRTLLLAPVRFGLWYWGRSDRTRWYPSVEIIRAPTWAESIEKARAAL